MRPQVSDSELNRLVAALNAIRQGDLTVRLPTEATNSPEVAQAFNAMAAQLGAITADVQRVLTEVRRGQLGGQVEVERADGQWRALVDDTNALAATMTDYVRGFAEVSTSVARGDMSKTVTIEAHGELLALKNVINTMVECLRIFAAEANRVMKELAADGKISPQAGSDGLSGLWKDLTDNVSLAEQVATLSRYKSEFLANMSHELRTPLNSMLILSKLLAENRDANLTSKQVEFAQTILGAGSDLLTLINDILDLSKVESGKMRVAPTLVDLEEVKAIALRTFQPIAEQKGLAYSVELDTPRKIYTDLQRLHQVLRNLLSNALKFTDKGQVGLRISGAGGRVAFAVTDTGIGIRADKQELIFEAFRQADGSTARRYGGTGLGLSISRAIARLLGGEIRVESEPDRGSTFTLVLPEQYVRPKGEEDDVEPAPVVPAVVHQVERMVDHGLAGRTALVIDDDTRNIFALVGALEVQGLQVLYAESGQEGIACLKARPEIDVVLMDMMMPGLDGYDTMRAIRRDASLASMPIIAVTAQALAEDRAKCLIAGASEYLAKPIDVADLVAAIKRLVQ
jgi:signal transduction histidine kinase/ActR/RegA family two-component response regulator